MTVTYLIFSKKSQLNNHSQKPEMNYSQKYLTRIVINTYFSETFVWNILTGSKSYSHSIGQIESFKIKIAIHNTINTYCVRAILATTNYCISLDLHISRRQRSKLGTQLLIYTRLKWYRYARQESRIPFGPRKWALARGGARQGRGGSEGAGEPTLRGLSNRESRFAARQRVCGHARRSPAAVVRTQSALSYIHEPLKAGVDECARVWWVSSASRLNKRCSSMYLQAEDPFLSSARFLSRLACATAVFLESDLISVSSFFYVNVLAWGRLFTLRFTWRKSVFCRLALESITGIEQWIWEWKF